MCVNKSFKFFNVPDDESDESFDKDPIDNDYINTEQQRPDYGKKN